MRADARQRARHQPAIRTSDHKRARHRQQRRAALALELTPEGERVLDEGYVLGVLVIGRADDARLAVR